MTRAALVVGAALLAGVAGTAAAGLEASIEGRIRDEAGIPIAGADVIVIGRPLEERRVTASDGRGWFSVAASSGVVRVEVHARGRVASRVLEVRAGDRSWIEIRGGEMSEPVLRAPLAEGALLGPAWVPTRTRDLRGLLATLPAGAPLEVLGARVFGAGPGEVRVSLDGFDLSDPIDGSEPLHLPLALFDGAVAALPSSGGGDDLPAAGLRLSSFAPGRSRHLEATLVGSHGVEGLPVGRPGGGDPVAVGAAPSAGAEIRVGGVPHPHVRWAVAAAPGTVSRRFARAGSRAAESERRFPALARVDGWRGRWSIGGVGLWSSAALEPAALPSVSRSGDLLRRDDRRWLVGIRGLRDSAVSRVELPAQIFDTETTTSTYGGDTALSSQRWALAPSFAMTGELGGRHTAGCVLEVGLTRARRTGAEPARLRPEIVTGSRASGRHLALGVSERYEPASWLDLDASVRLEIAGADASADLDDGTRLPSSLSYAGLIAPRGALRLHHPSGSGLRIAAGRYAWPLPIGAMLAHPGAQASGVTIPHEDVASAGIELRRARAALALVAVERRLRAVVEDGISSATGLPALENPSGVERRYRALVLQGAFSIGRLDVVASYALSSLTGNFTGFAEPELGIFRPGTTAQLDLPGIGVNRQGPLPADRRHALRLGARAHLHGPAGDLEFVAAARADSGTPLSALARSPFAGPGEVFVVERGSLGRLGWTAAVDARASAARLTHIGRIEAFIEGFNLTNSRAVTARDPIFSDDAVAPVPARGPDALPAARGPGGRVPTENPQFLTATAAAEPLLVRIGLTFEL